MINRKRYTATAAFTLVELMIVVTIISILIGLGIPRFRQAQLKAKVAVYLADRKIIADAVEIYRLRNNGENPPKGRDSQGNDFTLASVTGLHDYLDPKFHQPSTNPFGSEPWWAWSDDGGGPFFNIIIVVHDDNYAQEIMRYIPNDGRTSTLGGGWIVYKI